MRINDKNPTTNTLNGSMNSTTSTISPMSTTEAIKVMAKISTTTTSASTVTFAPASLASTAERVAVASSAILPSPATAIRIKYTTNIRPRIRSKSSVLELPTAAAAVHSSGSRPSSNTNCNHATNHAFAANSLATDAVGDVDAITEQNNASKRQSVYIKMPSRHPILASALLAVVIFLIELNVNEAYLQQNPSDITEKNWFVNRQEQLSPVQMQNFSKSTSKSFQVQNMSIAKTTTTATTITAVDLLEVSISELTTVEPVHSKLPTTTLLTQTSTANVSKLLTGALVLALEAVDLVQQQSVSPPTTVIAPRPAPTTTTRTTTLLVTTNISTDVKQVKIRAPSLNQMATSESDALTNVHMSHGNHIRQVGANRLEAEDIRYHHNKHQQHELLTELAAGPDEANEAAEQTDNENENENEGDWLLELPSNTLNQINGNLSFDLSALNEEEQAATDLLTKGFSIPTYLPPFPVFAVADLPAYLNSVSTTTTTTSTTSASPDGSPDGMAVPASAELSNTFHLENSLIHQTAGGRVYSTTLRPNVTVQMGNHAYMPCNIERVQNKPVSWVRLRDGHILSVDHTTFIADQRFQAIYQEDNDHHLAWLLQIKYVQPMDEGWYECQVSVEPKIGSKLYLKVIVPLTELIGDQSRFVKAGSKVALHCIVRGTLEPPQYIIWYRDKIQIGDDNKFGWYTQLDRNIFGNTESNQNTIGSLIIPSVRKVDSGNYTCQPSNSAAVSVDLHVLSGEYSASAIMSMASKHELRHCRMLFVMLLTACGIGSWLPT